MKKLLLLATLLIFMGACKDKSVSFEEQLRIDTEIIDNHISENNLTFQKTESGLYYNISTVGGGSQPANSSTVTVGYKGYFLDGTVFDETQPGAWAQFAVNGVVPGFGEAVRLLKKGGKGTFILPSGIAYGAYGSGSIPPNTPLIFDISLVDFY